MESKLVTEQEKADTFMKSLELEKALINQRISNIITAQRVYLDIQKKSLRV